MKILNAQNVWQMERRENDVWGDGGRINGKWREISLFVKCFERYSWKVLFKDQMLLFDIYSIFL